MKLLISVLVLISMSAFADYRYTINANKNMQLSAKGTSSVYNLSRAGTTYLPAMTSNRNKNAFIEYLNGTELQRHMFILQSMNHDFVGCSLPTDNCFRDLTPNDISNQASIISEIGSWVGITYPYISITMTIDCKQPAQTYYDSTNKVRWFYYYITLYKNNVTSSCLISNFGSSIAPL